MKKAEVLVLGSFHFHQEGVQFLDILSDERQKQVAQIAQKLSRFNPTKVAIEAVPEKYGEFNDKYHKFLQDGIIDIENVLDKSQPVADNMADVDERVMLGFRIAKACNIKDLHTIDYMNEWLYNEAFAYAQEKQPQLAKEIEIKMEEFVDSEMSHIGGGLTEIYRYLNSDEGINKQHSDMFLIMNQIGAYDNYIGEQFVLSWYERNLKIFANLQHLCEDGDRVLVIIGAAHTATLNSLIKDYYKMDFISPLSFL